MPKEYNRPNWFSAEYDKAATILITAIQTCFEVSPHIDVEYLNDLQTSYSQEDTHLGHLLTSGQQPVWDGPERNVGWNAINLKNRYVFQALLPSYMIACIEVRDKGSSPAENSDMPEILARRLSSLSGYDFTELLEGLSAEQMQLIRSVLDLLAHRNDDAGKAAQTAIQGFWYKIAPIQCGSESRRTPGE